ncbi:MAG TPA: hypothetical protein VMT30_03670 [Candidatus Saccharimonadia bacterium]|nr:hypothetical protein [Candidatus Saccharimonadia bacterium]
MSKPTLTQNLAHAEAIKREMTELLRELESRATGKSVPGKPGGWRHHPVEWAAQNLSQTPVPPT